MRLKDHPISILDAISSCPYVESQRLSFEERAPDAAYINGEISFINGSKLHFKEFIVCAEEKIIFLKYVYNYISQSNLLIFRYDNAVDPKAKGLSTYPAHKHLQSRIIAAGRPALKDVLREIADSMETKRQ